MAASIGRRMAASIIAGLASSEHRGTAVALRSPRAPRCPQVVGALAFSPSGRYCPGPPRTRVYARERRRLGPARTLARCLFLAVGGAPQTTVESREGCAVHS